MKEQIFYASKNGHIFAVKHTRRGYSVLTNEYGMQTHVVWAYAKKILGIK